MKVRLGLGELEKLIEKGRRGVPKAQHVGPVWRGRPAPPSYTVARCGWTGRTRNAREHKKHRRGGCVPVVTA